MASTADQGTGEERHERVKSVGRKFLSRVKMALSLRRSEPSKRQSILPTTITTTPGPTLLATETAPNTLLPTTAPSGTGLATQTIRYSHSSYTTPSSLTLTAPPYYCRCHILLSHRHSFILVNNELTLLAVILNNKPCL